MKIPVSLFSIGFAGISLGMSFNVVDLMYETELIDSIDGIELYLVHIDDSPFKSDEGSERAFDLFLMYNEPISSISLAVEDGIVTYILIILSNSRTGINSSYLNMYYAYTSAFGYPEVVHLPEGNIFPSLTWHDYYSGEYVYLGSPTKIDDTSTMTIMIGYDEQSEDEPGL